MIKAMIIGNLGADAVRKDINGVSYLSFSVAHSVRKTTGEEKTTWVDCLMRGGEKLQEYLRRGQMVWLMGDFDATIYDSAKYHCKMISYSCFVDTLRLCGSRKEDAPKPDAGTAQTAEGTQYDPVTGEILPKDDLPFA